MTSLLHCNLFLPLPKLNLSDDLKAQKPVNTERESPHNKRAKFTR